MTTPGAGRSAVDVSVLTLSAEDEMLSQPQTFPCPNCNEIINETMERCRYCSAPVDRQAAALAAENQSKVNQACSDASFLRTAAAVMFALLGLSLLPFVALIAYLGFILTFLAVVVMLIRWQMKFGRLQTRDPDYLRAKRLKNVTLLLWVLAVPAFLVREVVGVIIAGLISQ